MTFRKFFSLLDADDKRRLAFLVLLMFVAGGLEALGPLMLAFYLSPSPMIQSLMARLAGSVSGDTATLVGRYFPLVIGGFYVVKAVYATWLSNRMNRFAFSIQARIGAKALAAYMNMSFGQFRNTAKGTILRDVISETSQITFNFTLPTLQLISEGLVLVCLVATAVYISATATLTLALTMGVIGVLTYAVTRGYFRRFALRRREAEERRLQVLENAIAGWVNVRFSKATAVVAGEYHHYALEGALAEGRQQTLSMVPRQAFEIALVAALVATIYMNAWGSKEQATQIAIALAAVGFRLLPSVTRIGSCFQLFRYGGPTLESMHALIASAPMVQMASGDIVDVKHIELRDIAYRHRPDQPATFSEINHVFNRGTITGMSAPSGKGKTTLLNVLLGLLQPSHGTVLYDGQPVEDIQRHHRIEIGYLSQHPFVADGTAWENIRLGGDVAATDDEVIALLDAVGLVKIADQMRAGQDPMLGSQGLHLSGGEKQRFSLVRVLARKPSILVLDEPTNGLDKATEERMFELITAKKSSFVTVVASHHPSVLAHCDAVLHL